jgi:hypothetical protein
MGIADLKSERAGVRCHVCQGFLTVESRADFKKWLKSKSGATTSFE